MFQEWCFSKDVFVGNVHYNPLLVEMFFLTSVLSFMFFLGGEWSQPPQG